jgi:integrase
MQLVGRPKLAKALPPQAGGAILEPSPKTKTRNANRLGRTRSRNHSHCAIRRPSRAEELRQAVVGDIGTTVHGAEVIHVKGKGGKERSVPIEAELLSVIETYLDSRAIRFPGGEKRKATAAVSGLSRWSARSRFSSDATVNASTAERSDPGLNEPLNAPVRTRSPSPVPSYMVYAIRTPPSWPARTSASTL